MSTVQANLKGAVSKAILLALRSKSMGEALGVAESLGLPHTEIFLRSAIAPGTTSNMDALVAQRAANDWVQSVRAQSIVGKMPELRRVPFETALPAVIGDANSFWTGEGANIPLTQISLDTVTLPMRTNATIAAFSDALVRLTNAEDIVESELIAACAAGIDAAFIDPANAGSAQMPAAVTHGAPNVAATSNPVADLRGLFARSTVDMATSYLVTDASTAVSLALFTDSAGAIIFPDITARGGVIYGVPVIVSKSSPHDSNGGIVALIDAAGIMLADDGAQIDKSTSDVAMLTDPVSGAQSLTSLWQCNASAVRVLRHVNWAVARPGSVSYLRGVAY